MFEGRLQKKHSTASVPSLFCADDKSEGIHQIIIQEMKSDVSDQNFPITEVIPQVEPPGLEDSTEVPIFLLGI